MIIKEKRNNNLIGKTLTISIRKGIDVSEKNICQNREIEYGEPGYVYGEPGY